MARQLRINMEGGIHHVTSRGIERSDLFFDDHDRFKFMKIVDDVFSERRWRVFAMSLMSNHYHFFLQTPSRDLSDGMHDINAGYVNWFNRKHQRNGPLFQGRFKGILVEEAEHDWELSRYIHLNPVRAGLVTDPRGYQWSTCRYYFDAKNAPAWLDWERVLQRHGESLAKAREKYWEFLLEGIKKKLENPVREAKASVILGSARFVEDTLSQFSSESLDKDISGSKELRRYTDLIVIENAVCRVFKIAREQLRAKRTRNNVPRAMAIYLARKRSSLPLALIGKSFGGVSGQAVSSSVAVFSEMVSSSITVAGQLKRCEREIEREAGR